MTHKFTNVHCLNCLLFTVRLLYVLSMYAAMYLCIYMQQVNRYLCM